MHRRSAHIKSKDTVRTRKEPSLVLGHDVEAEPLVDGVGDALDARLDLERLVGEDLGRRLVVGDHAEEARAPLVVAVVLVPRRPQGLLFHQKEVAGPRVQLVQRSRIDGFLKLMRHEQSNM